MKKIFASLLALVGMVAGLTLTSCGGGGGQSNLENTTILFSAGSINYQISIGEKMDGSSASYYCTIGELGGTKNQVNAAFTVEEGANEETGIPDKMDCSLSSFEWTDDTRVVFVSILTGAYVETVNSFQAPELKLTLTRKGDGYEAKWSWSGDASYSDGEKDIPILGTPTAEALNSVTHSSISVTKG